MGALQWLNMCKCEHDKHKNMPRSRCITRNIDGEYCDDCIENCGCLTKCAVDAPLVAPADIAPSQSDSAGEVDSPPRPLAGNTAVSRLRAEGVSK